MEFNRVLAKSILSALNYHNLFDFPLKESEIFEFLIQAPSVKYGDPLEVEKNLKRLVDKKIINYKAPFYFFPGRQAIVGLRKAREKYSLKKIKIARKIVKILKLIPFIKMIGITGALAMNNAKKNDDIDFLMITAKNRLWLTRLTAIVILEILGKRRRPRGKIVKDKICLNMFLDETSLCQALAKQNLFTSHEIVQLKPIYNKDSTYEKFIGQNLWVKKYLPNGINKSQISKLKTQNHNSKLKSKKLLYHLITLSLNCLEVFAYRFQRKLMQSKKTREQVSFHFAFFHPKDRSSKILKDYQKKQQHLKVI